MMSYPSKTSNSGGLDPSSWRVMRAWRGPMKPEYGLLFFPLFLRVPGGRAYPNLNMHFTNSIPRHSSLLTSLRQMILRHRDPSELLQVPMPSAPSRTSSCTGPAFFLQCLADTMAALHSESDSRNGIVTGTIGLLRLTNRFLP
jgi:hypothetical protein